MRTFFAVVALLLLVGCGLQNGPGSGGHSNPPTTSGTTAAPPTPSVPPITCVHLKTSPSLRTVSLSYANNHGSFCVKRGSGVFVFLHARTPELWAPIQSSTLALQRRPSGVMSLPVGETGAFFDAANVGTTVLTSFEARCKSGPHAGAGGRCPAPLRFAVTVHVLG